MTENQKKILEMVADKKITVDEAYRLLSLIQPSADSGNGGPKERKPSPKYLRVVVDTEHIGKTAATAARRISISVCRWL